MIDLSLLLRRRRFLTDQVFGMRSDANPLSYVKRSVEVDFERALADPMLEVISIYGASKQGKSSLRRSVLPSNKCAFVSANSSSTRESVYRELLSHVGVRDTQSREISHEREAWQGGSLAAPIGGLEIGRRRQVNEIQRDADVALDYSMASSVARRYAQRVGRLPIVIDNFHYFGIAAQSEIATDIRSFGELGIKVVVLGTWRGRDHLQQLNPDLTSRSESITIEPWSISDLSKIIYRGNTLLNVEISEDVVGECARKSAGCVGILQRVYRDYILSVGVEATLRTRRILSDQTAIWAAFNRFADSQIEPTASKIAKIAEIGERWAGGRTRMYWVLRSLLGQSSLVSGSGVSVSAVHGAANRQLELAGLSERFSVGDVASLLKSALLKGQQRRLDAPVLLFDDVGDRVSVVDGWTLFTLRRRRDLVLGAL